MLVFDKENHIFTFNGQEVPGVTRIIKSAGCVSEFAQTDEWYADFGTAAHHMIRLDLEGNLDESSVQDILQPTLKAWRSFRSDFKHLYPITTQDQGLLAEKPLYHQTYKYAGIPDLPMFDKAGNYYIVDLKNTNIKQPYWELQFSAYEELLKVNTGIRKKFVKFALVIPRGSDKYRLVKCTDNTSLFLACLNLYKWKQKHNLNNQFQKEEF